METHRGEKTGPIRPQQRLLIGAIVSLAGVGGFAAGRALLRPTEAVPQPIAFNHRRHVEDAGVECDVCHEHYSTGQHSGLPALSLCLDCHDEPVTEEPEEQKLRDLAGAEDEVAFRKLFRLPDNVFYSHRRHVTIAGLECETCHGEIAATASPPPEPLIHVTMDFCLDCHERSGASDACTGCHR